MVNSISNNAIRSLLQAQSSSAQSSASSLKGNQKTALAIIDQLKAGPSAPTGKSVQIASSASPSSSMPRGSLIDFYA